MLTLWSFKDLLVKCATLQLHVPPAPGPSRVPPPPSHSRRLFRSELEVFREWAVLSLESWEGFLWGLRPFLDTGK